MASNIRNEVLSDKDEYLMRMKTMIVSPLMFPSCACLYSVPLFLFCHHLSEAAHRKNPCKLNFPQLAMHTPIFSVDS